MILDLWGVPHHAMVVVFPEHNFSIDSGSAYCGTQPRKLFINTFSDSQQTTIESKAQLPQQLFFCKCVYIGAESFFFNNFLQV